MKKSLFHTSALALCALAAPSAWAQTAAPQAAGVPSAQKTGTSAVTTGATAAVTSATGTTQGATTPTKAARRTPALSTYRIGRDDILQITCLNSPDFSETATVLPDGTISYPKLGQVTALGMTPAQLEVKLRAFLKTEFVRPNVTVSVRERQVRQVSIIGSGIKGIGGKRVMRDGWRVLDAIGDTGGLLSDRTDLFTARLIRPGTGDVFPLDLPRVLANDPEANLLLEPNDLLIIDSKEEKDSQVQVTGEVLRPGFYVIPRDRSIGKALEAAGGPKLATARLSAAVIEHPNGEKETVDLLPLEQGKGEPDIKLQPGDILRIPENKRLVYLTGAFGRQGATLLPDDRPLTLTQALSDAALSIPQAETKKTTLTRSEADGTTKSYNINVDDMLNHRDAQKDIVLRNGDLIYVPFKRGHKFSLQDAVPYVTTIPSLFYVARGHY